MKQCPRCQRTYDDDELNFCLEDGEVLAALQYRPYADDSPPTVLLDQSRITNPAEWPAASNPLAEWQPSGHPFHQPPQYPIRLTRNQSLAATSLALGVASLTIGWCCSTGMLLSPAALVTGFIALSQIRKDPSRYGGRGLALGGIVTGVIYFCVVLLILLIWGSSLILNGLSQIQ